MMYRVACHSTTCSIIFHKINICPTVPLLLLKPACSYLNSLLTPSLILSMSTLPNTLLGTDVKVIPLQFPHSVRSPFIGILTISYCFYIFGIFSCSQNVLLFFIFLIADLISAFVIGSVLISFMIGSISTFVTGSSGTCLLRTSSVFFPSLPTGQTFRYVPLPLLPWQGGRPTSSCLVSCSSSLLCLYTYIYPCNSA